MKKRFTALAAAFFVFVASFSAYADPVASPAEAEIEFVDIQSELGYVPSWSEAVAAVQAQRDAASVVSDDSAATSSEAEIMLLSDDDYGISLASSLGTVTNTIDYTGVQGVAVYRDVDGSAWYTKGFVVNSDGSFSVDVGKNRRIGNLRFDMYRTALPSAGMYEFSFDLASHIGITYSNVQMAYNRSVNNASTTWGYINGFSYSQSSGDVYCPPFLLDLGSVGCLTIDLHFTETTNVYSGSIRVNFKQSFETESDYGTANYSAASQEVYQDTVSSSLGSIGDTLEDIVETISLQLEALWNQMYNYIHLPEYEKLEQIRQAIENIRLDVDVDNQDVVNKLDEQISNDNANREQIINGYDSSASDTAETELDAALDIGKDSESEAMNSDAVNSFKEFEFPVPSENPPEVINACLFVGNYLQRLYTAIGIFNIPIDVSLVLIIAMLVIGFYRVRMRG